MSDTPAETQSLRKQILEINSLLNRATRSLSQSTDPLAAQALWELESLTDALNSLWTGGEVINPTDQAQNDPIVKNDAEPPSALTGKAALNLEAARQLDALLKANQELEETNAGLENACDLLIKGWVQTLDMRDQETPGHTQRVAALARILARAVGIDETGLIQITRGAWLHDIGKMGVPDNLLLKSGTLTPEEWSRMQQHTVLAFEMLKPVRFLGAAIDVPYCHHERWDGTGYPRGLSGEAIPLLARIFSIVDVWDALTSERPYHKAMTPKEAQHVINRQAGTQFDPRFVAVFLGLDDLPTKLANEQLVF
jgi:putative nucleotidyltransferase with HDIG domain